MNEIQDVLAGSERNYPDLGKSLAITAATASWYNQSPLDYFFFSPGPAADLNMMLRVFMLLSIFVVMSMFIFKFMLILGLMLNLIMILILILIIMLKLMLRVVSDSVPPC